MKEWERIRNANRFIENAKSVRCNEDYDYSLVLDMYVNNRTKVAVIDNAINPKTGKPYGKFMVSPSNLLKGRGHPERRGDRISKTKTYTTEEYIRRAKEAHRGENLDYSQTVYKGAHEKVYIIDHDLRPDGTEYGGYWQEANAHLKGCGHPDKGTQRRVDVQKLTINQVRSKFKELFPEKDYVIPDQEYTNNRVKIGVICKKHGEFEISVGNLFKGKGCPSCAHSISKPENELYEFLLNYFSESEIKRKVKSILKNNKEIDIYIPSKKVGIEYNGIRWHSEEFGKDKYYHLNKLEEAKEKGITLIQVFEDEFLKHKDIVFSKLSHILGCDRGLLKVMARKCVVKEIRKSVAEEFLNVYHIQGYASATVYLGCFYKEKLIGVMTLLNDGNGSWNLTRFASDTNLVCQGVGGKLFKYFLRNYNPTEVKTFLDRRWEHNVDNNVYIKMGFVVDKYEAPDYMYTDGHGGDREHKFGFRKQVLNRKYGLPLSMTENEMVKELGYFKVWNCGLIKYIWRKQ